MGKEDMVWILSAIGLTGTGLAWFIKVSIENQLSKVCETLRGEFGDKFLDAAVAQVKLSNMEKDISYLGNRINQVEEYSHKINHEMNNKIQDIKLKLND